MMPENKLSTFNVYSPFLVPSRTSTLIDYEWGGVDLHDTGAGMHDTIWTCMYSGDKIQLTNGTVTYDLLTAEDVTDLSFAFDLNMNPNVIYRAQGMTYFWWYDTSVSAQITIELGTDYLMPQLSLDDNRGNQVANADIVMAYIRDKKLCMRIQRDRYEVEYVLATAQSLTQIGMTKNYRFSFRAKVINTFDIMHDEAVVFLRNPKDSILNHLMLCPLMTSYSVDFGDDTHKNQGVEGDWLSAGLENELYLVQSNFILKAIDYEYLLSFYRLWQHTLSPFYVDLVIDQRALQTYKAHFVPGSMTMQKNGEFFQVSAQLSVLENRYDKTINHQLATSRNIKIARS